MAVLRDASRTPAAMNWRISFENETFRASANRRTSAVSEGLSRRLRTCDRTSRFFWGFATDRPPLTNVA